MTQWNLRLLSTIVFCAGVWYAVLQYSRWRASPEWYERAEIVAGAAGLVTIFSWLPLANALARWTLVDKPILWSLKWTLIGVVSAMMLLLAVKIGLEQTGYWEPVDGVEDRRKFDFGDDSESGADSAGGKP